MRSSFGRVAPLRLVVYSAGTCYNDPAAPASASLAGAAPRAGAPPPRTRRRAKGDHRPMPTPTHAWLAALIQAEQSALGAALAAEARARFPFYAALPPL